MVGGTFDAASQAPYVYSGHSKDLLRELAGEIAIQLTAYQQLTRQGKWLAAIAEYVRTEQIGTLEISTPQLGRSPWSPVSHFSPGARLGHAFRSRPGLRRCIFRGWVLICQRVQMPWELPPSKSRMPSRWLSSPQWMRMARSPVSRCASHLGQLI